MNMIIILSLFFSQVWMLAMIGPVHTYNEVISPCATTTDRLPADFVNCATWNNAGGLCLQNLVPNEIRNLDQCRIADHSYLPGLSIVLTDPTSNCNPYYLTVTECVTANGAHARYHSDKRNKTNAKRDEEVVYNPSSKINAYNYNSINTKLDYVQTALRFIGTGPKRACHCNPSGPCITVKGSCLPLCAESDCSRVRVIAPNAAIGIDAPSLFQDEIGYIEAVKQFPPYLHIRIIRSYGLSFGLYGNGWIRTHLNVFTRSYGVTRTYRSGYTYNYPSSLAVSRSSVYWGARNSVTATLANTGGFLVASSALVTNFNVGSFNTGAISFLGKRNRTKV